MAVPRRMWERPRGSQAEWARMTADPVANAIALSASSAAAGSGARAAARQETLRAARLRLAGAEPTLSPLGSPRAASILFGAPRG